MKRFLIQASRYRATDGLVVFDDKIPFFGWFRLMFRVKSAFIPVTDWFAEIVYLVGSSFTENAPLRLTVFLPLSSVP